MEVVLYALSTCGWCRRTKKMLDEAGVEYRALDVDLLEGEEKEQARAQVACHNPRRSYPTLVVDGEKVVIGYNEQRLREVLGI
ncbi:MAG: glutaredoxin family protein [Deltaproteobacteria bacterium]|nr:MAG: glutaredoxin family protein [Deltaproteobacteria bacterium]